MPASATPAARPSLLMTYLQRCLIFTDYQFDKLTYRLILLTYSRSSFDNCSLKRVIWLINRVIGESPDFGLMMQSIGICRGANFMLLRAFKLLILCSHRLRNLSCVIYPNKHYYLTVATGRPDYCIQYIHGSLGC